MERALHISFYSRLLHDLPMIVTNFHTETKTSLKFQKLL